MTDASDRPVLLITGASAGIGAATARLAATRGWDLAIHYNRDRAGAEAVARDAEASGARTTLLQADMADPAAIPALFAAFDAAFPRLDGLVNNAGIIAPTARVDEFDAARVARLMAVNVTAPILVAGSAVRRMSSRHGGHGGSIVNVSSGAARLGSPGLYVDYAASKGALESFTTGLALEVAEEGIRVNAIRPGIIATEIHAKAGLTDRLDKAAAQLPMKRVGRAEEVAEGILWLLSDAASYTTGTFLDVTGGR